MGEKMIAFEAKAAESHAASAEAREALKDEIAANAEEVSTMIKDAVATDASARCALQNDVATAIKATNTNIDAYSNQMREIATEVRANIDATNADTMEAIKTEHERAQAATEKFTSEDAARQAAAYKFLEEQLAVAKEEVDTKFGHAYEKMADDREAAENQLSAAYEGLNDSLAKQAALADSRFKDTVEDIDAARKEAADQVAQFRKEFAAELYCTTALVKNTEQKLADNLQKVAAEVTTMKANQCAINAQVQEELHFIEELSNHRHSVNKAAAAAEVNALSEHLHTELDKARAHNAHNKRAMAKDLTDATEKFYEKLASQRKAQDAAHTGLETAINTEVAVANAELARAQEDFDSKIIMLADTVSEHAHEAKEEFTRVTGVVNDYAAAAAADRELIKDETKAMEADLNKALDRAIAIGEAKAKAVEQRIAEHLKDTKRYLQVELNESVERAADNVYKIIEGERQKIADNYLSLKAYAVASADKVEDAVEKGAGSALSSIGDLLLTVGALGPVKAKPADGLGMGGTELPSIFSGETIKVSGAVSAINGLNNEYTESCKDVRNRWPMGLGKYLLDKLETSMA